MADGGRLLVQVCGDATVDWLAVADRERVAVRGAYYWRAVQPRDRVRLGAQAGGAALITTLLEAMLPEDRARLEGVKLEPKSLSQAQDSQLTTSWTLWEKYLPEKEEGQAAFRIAEWRECEPGLGGLYPEFHRMPDLLVIDDAGLDFHKHQQKWPAALRQRAEAPEKPRCVILKIVPYQYNEEPKGQTKRSCPPMVGPIARRIHEIGLANRTTALIGLDDLRTCAVHIGRSLSWESLLEEVVDAVTSPTCPISPEGVLMFQRVIVTVGPNGAVVVEKEDAGDKGRQGKLRCSLVFDRTGQEGDFALRVPGAMLGYNTCVVGALATAWVTAQGAPDWVQATRDGIALARFLHLRGYEVCEQQGRKHLRFPANDLAETYHAWQRAKAREIGQNSRRRNRWADSRNKHWEIALDLGIFRDQDGLIVDTDQHGHWTILQESLRRRAPGGTTSRFQLLEQICKQAHDIVTQGPSDALEDVPIESAGNWRSADRKEIEGVRSVTNAMREYCARPRPDKPLCVAVFGPPGSGKSFVITEIARSLGLDPADRLVFNLSQMESPDKLANAFHQIRDLQLRGRTPLVFWDEFDTPCQGQALGWLRYFLAPMQDGLFYDRGQVHPTGGGIYVFAGATCHSFEEFCVCGGPEDVAAKKPDFVSRLHAYVDVRGPNGEPNTVEDILYPIRRAFLLNALLERHAAHLKDAHGNFSVDEGIIQAFLRVTRYKHGARSLEAILVTSSLRGKKKFELSCLPPESILRMHVDAEEFTRLSRQQGLKMLRVGITGHRYLDPDRMAALEAGIDQAIQLIATSKEYSDCYLTVFSPLAAGAYRLVARKLLERPNSRLIVVLALPRDDFINDFGPTDDPNVDPEGADLRKEFRYWLDHRAVEVIELPPAPTRAEAYRNLGCFIADHCDVLIAVWDGNPPQGPAGTGFIVQRAIEQGKPVVHVWAGNHKPEADKRTDVGRLHGKVRRINFPRQRHRAWIGAGAKLGVPPGTKTGAE